MNKLSTITLATVAVMLTAQVANATCYKSGNYVTCTDGSSYNTFGNTTYGSNSNTGSTWSQSTFGSMTYGNDSDGNSWSYDHSTGLGYSNRSNNWWD